MTSSSQLSEHPVSVISTDTTVSRWNLDAVNGSVYTFAGEEKSSVKALTEDRKRPLTFLPRPKSITSLRQDRTSNPKCTPSHDVSTLDGAAAVDVIQVTMAATRERERETPPLP